MDERLKSKTSGSMTASDSSSLKGSLKKVGRFEILISQVLRGGTYLSGFVILGGWILSSLERKGPGQSSSLEHLLRGEILTISPVPPAFFSLLQQALHFVPSAVIALGIRCLLALPIARVVLTIVLFLVEKDYIFCLLSSLVFMTLCLGTFFGSAL